MHGRPDVTREVGRTPGTAKVDADSFSPIDAKDETLLRVLLQGLPHAVRIYDGEGRPLMANDLGRSAELLRVFARENHVGFVPFTEDQWESWPVARVLASGRPATQNYIIEHGEDSTAFLDVMALPVMGERGKPRLVIEITRDVTESTVQTAKLRRLELLIAEMVNQLSGVVASSDSLGDLPLRIEALDGGGCPHLVSCPMFTATDGKPADVGNHSFEVCAHCQVAQLAYPDQLHHLTSSLDGLLQTLHSKHQQLLDSQREVIHAERLAAVGELVAGIAHEINNPLSIILARLDAIELENQGDTMPQVLGEDLRVIRQHSERITRTVESLLTFCRKSPRRVTVDFDLNAVLREGLEFVRSMMGRRAIRLEARLSSGPITLHGDPAALEQVFINLFINGADAMGGDGELTITSQVTRGDAPEAVVTVSDTGPGVPPDLIGRVFDPFFTTKQSRGGTGLGLSVSRRIVEDFGGEIGVTSPPGEGATFRIALPLRGEAL